MTDMATQMRALDDFVTRARSQNEAHHTAHVQSLQNLATTVNASYLSIGDHLHSTYGRVRDVGTDLSSQTSTLQSSIPPLNETIAQPLSNLRASITNAPLKEYTPTGETPQKTTYHIPSTLPRTEPHDKLLAKHFLRQQASSPHKASTSPSKALIYTDMHTTTSAPPSPTKPILPGSGLKEVNMNVALNPAAAVSRHSDPNIAAAEPAKFDVSDFSKSVHVDFSKSVGAGAGGGMGPPPLKRQHTMGSGESKLPTKFGGGKGVGFRGGGGPEGGKENQGAQGRRLLRSSHSHMG